MPTVETHILIQFPNPLDLEGQQELWDEVATWLEDENVDFSSKSFPSKLPPDLVRSNLAFVRIDSKIDHTSGKLEHSLGAFGRLLAGCYEYGIPFENDFGDHPTLPIVLGPIDVVKAPAPKVVETQFAIGGRPVEFLADSKSIRCGCFTTKASTLKSVLCSWTPGVKPRWQGWNDFGDFVYFESGCRHVASFIFVSRDYLVGILREAEKRFNLPPAVLPTAPAPVYSAPTPAPKPAPSTPKPAPEGKWMVGEHRVQFNGLEISIGCFRFPVRSLRDALRNWTPTCWKHYHRFRNRSITFGPESITDIASGITVSRTFLQDILAEAERRLGR